MLLGYVYTCAPCKYYCLLLLIVCCLLINVKIRGFYRCHELSRRNVVPIQVIMECLNIALPRETLELTRGCLKGTSRRVNELIGSWTIG